MKAAVYVRDSTNEDRQHPELQLSPIQRYCALNGIQADCFQEFASGAKSSRPQLDRMMQGVRAGLYDRVIVWRLDRLGRSLQHLLQLLEEFRNKRVKFVSITEAFDTSTAGGELFFNIAGSFAQFERKLIQERVNAGLAVAREKGKKLGRPSGSKDKKQRRRSGYWQRWAGKKSTPQNSKPTSIALAAVSNNETIT